MFQRSTTGVDIGATGIRVVQVADGKARRFASTPLPDGLVVDGVIADPAQVGQRLRALWATARLRGKEVRLCVGGPRVVCRQWQTDWMPAIDLRRALPFTAREQVAVANPYLDCHPIAEWDEPGQGRQAQVLLVSSPPEPIDNLVGACENAGLHPSAVDTAAFALIRATQKTLTPGQDPHLIVNIGAHITTLVLHHGGVPLRVETSTTCGSAAIDVALAEAFGVPLDQAARAKAEVGLRQDPSAGGKGVPVIAAHASNLIGEVRSFLELAAGPAGDTATVPALIHLTGGGGRLPGLPERMGAELGIPTGYLPAAAMTAGLPSGQGVSEPDYMCALGVALEG